MSKVMLYAILRKPRTVAHLTEEPLGNPLCRRLADMTSNVPGGRRVCRDCMARWRASRTEETPQ